LVIGWLRARTKAPSKKDDDPDPVNILRSHGQEHALAEFADHETKSAEMNFLMQKRS